ncbi:MAG: hypothetical protein LBI79_01705 [Nitrososphaerota archaeon]|jgi:hypothetical protein|nr:hypothetical protein [Nitrososphaerota archaeon]
MSKTQKKQRTINEILGNLDLLQQETLQNLRLLIKSEAPEAVELVKQGKIVYKLENKDFVWISRYQNRFDIEFAMGTSIASDIVKRRGIAEQNKKIRHVTVGNFATIKPELTRLVREAATLGLEYWKPA